ncbi:MAG: cupredoxin domain-containing protein [Myxococcales bacterium]|nr:cupredoxin domain-containing protein [Myxococcales bacterium]
MRFFLVLLLLTACRKQLATGVVDISVTEKGFEPARVDAAPGAPLTLRFTRKIKETCADAVDVEGDPVRHMLPVDVPVEIKVKAPPSGELAFACPMKMVNGAIVVVGH